MIIIDFGRISIPFLFNGCVITLKVTKFSTCNDVEHMILHKVNLPVSKVTLYAIFEQTSSVEPMLPGKSLVYKVYRSWGCENGNFQFHVIGKSAKELCLGIKRNLANSSAEGEIDRLFINHYTRKTAHTISTELERKESIVRHPEPTRSVHASLKLSEDALNKHDTSANGKQMVLARFMNDVASRSANKPGNKKYRGQGDGAERNDLCRRQGDGSESDHIYVCHNKIRSQHDSCLSFLDQTYITESEINTDFIDSSSLADYDHVSFHDDASSSLDMAFLKTSGGSDSDEGIDVTSVDSDLDVAFNEEYFITNIRGNTSHLKSSHPCEYSHVIQNNTLDKTLCADKLVKELFGRAHNISEDEAMDSFMRSSEDSF